MRALSPAYIVSLVDKHVWHVFRGIDYPAVNVKHGILAFFKYSYFLA